ncbi:MAG: heme-binding protein [Pseudomonadota bacterium]
MKIFPILILLTVLIQSCANMPKEGTYKGYETPAYKVEKQSENIEIRAYEKKLIAEVEVFGDRKEAANKGFRILAGYIFGSNIADQKVAMTSPVMQEAKSEKISITSPVAQIASKNSADSKEQKWQVQFTMPGKYSLETLPKPKNSAIKFKIEPAKKLVAIKFDGLWNDKTFAEQKAILEKFITQNNLKTKSQPIIAYYDDPFTFPWNRRNEIMFEIK